MKSVINFLKRVQNKILKESSKYSLLVDAFIKYGYKSAYHLDCEQKALIKGEWSLVKLCFERKIQSMSSKKNSTVCRVYFYIVNDANTFEDILNFVKKEKHEIKYNELESLYLYCKYFHDLRIALFLREILIKRMVDRNKNTFYSTKKSINAAIEAHQYKLANKLLNNKVRLFGASYYNCADRVVNVSTKCNLKHIKSKDLDFYKYISGKTVAIVGPGIPIDQPGEEIDSYDIVVRTNYRDKSNYPIEKFGKRTDVSYYNHYRITSFLSEVIKASSEIIWTILKNDSAKNILDTGITGNFSYNSRSMDTVIPLFFLDSQPMSIPNVLEDIIRFNPLSVKLFCVNFYNSKSNYSDHYKKTIPYDMGVQIKDIRIHEPFANFSFVKGYYERNLIDVDNLTKETLELSVEEYAANLHNIFGPNGIA
jgi:hypothetical protein